jgi:hypothetical protein
MLAVARQRRPGSRAPSSAPVSLTRQEDERALRDIKQEIDNWLFAYVQHWRCVDPESFIGVVLEPMKHDEVRAFVAAHFRELWDKVLPERLKKAYAEVQARLDAGTNVAAAEEWLPATEAVDRVEKGGGSITLKWLTQDAAKHGVRTRPSQLPGRHKVEVEWNSLAGYLLRRASSEKEPDETTVGDRLREEEERKRRERPLD